MEQLKTTNIFVPVKEIEEHSLIEEAVSDIVTICSLNNTESAKELISSQFLVMNNLDYEKKELYTLTREELERVIGDAFADGQKSVEAKLRCEQYGDMDYYAEKVINQTKEQYINQIIP